MIWEYLLTVRIENAWTFLLRPTADVYMFIRNYMDQILEMLKFDRKVSDDWERHYRKLHSNNVNVSHDHTVYNYCTHIMAKNHE